MVSSVCATSTCVAEALPYRIFILKVSPVVHWCVGMFGARFAVFPQTARVLPSPSQATRNLSFLEVLTGAVTLLFELVVSLDWYGLD